jgi:hypothetical protein
MRLASTGFAALLFLVFSAVPSSAEWLKPYPVPVYGAHWHVELEVSVFSEARDKALKILKKYDGVPHIPLTNLARGEKLTFQQFSFRLSRKEAKKVFKKLRRLGKVRRSSQKESSLVDYSKEIELKINRLNTEKKAGGEIFNRLVSMREILEELLGRLEASAAGYRSAKDTVLLNIVLEEKKAK